MSKKSIALLFILIAAPLIIYLIWPSDESRIKKLFREGAQAVEKEDLDAAMSKVSYNYRDEYGLSYLYMKEIMKSAFQRMKDIKKDIKVEYGNLKINITDRTATADMDVRIIATIGNDTGYIIGDLPNPAHLKFTLEKERTTWLVTKTEGLPFHF